MRICKVLPLCCCRKKRKWDQPAESLVSAGLAASGVFPAGSVGSLSGSTLPVVSPMPCTVLKNPLAASCVSVPQVIQAPSIQQNSAAALPKSIQVRCPIWVSLKFCVAMFSLV